MAAHRHWRLYVTAVANGGGYVAIEEFAFVGADGAVLSVGGTPSASSEYPGGYQASKAFDGNFSTLWHSGTGSLPQWLAYDFGSAVEVVGVRIMPRQENVNQSPKDFKLQYSDDGSSWADAFSIAGVTSWSLGIPQSFPSVDHRAWRVLVTETHGGGACAFSSVEFRATAGGANIATTDVWGFASASYIGYTSPYGPRKAFDNDAATLWSGTGAPPVHLGYHFGADVVIEEVVLRSRGDSNPEQSPKAFQLQYLDAAGAWNTVMSVSDIPVWSLGESRTYTVGPNVQPVLGSIPVSLSASASIKLGTSLSGDAGVALSATAAIQTGTHLAATSQIEVTPRGRLAGASATPGSGNFFLLF